jgi:hypothetical protein
MIIVCFYRVMTPLKHWLPYVTLSIVLGVADVQAWLTNENLELTIPDSLRTSMQHMFPFIRYRVIQDGLMLVSQNPRKYDYLLETLVQFDYGASKADAFLELGGGGSVIIPVLVAKLRSLEAKENPGPLIICL